MDSVVHISPNGESKTFAEYAEVVFIPRAFFGTGKTQRVDLVWDVFMKLFQRGQTEEHASECLAMPSFQGTGKQTSYEMMTIRVNSSCS